MSISLLSRSTQRFLLDRLDRLRESLEGLGHRLRECLADIIGTQVGEAVRDAIDKTLHLKSSPAAPVYERSERIGTDPEGSTHDWHWQEEEVDEPFPSQAEEPEPKPSPMQIPEQGPKPSRWKYLLTNLVELAGWWLQRGPKKLPLRKLLGLSALVGTATLVAGPVIGGVAMTISTALLLTSGEPTSQTEFL